MSDLTQTAEPVPGLFSRAVAFVIDLLIVWVLIVFAQVLDLPSWGIGVIAFMYFALFPLTPLQATPGKSALKLRLCDRDNKPLSWRSSIIRAGAILGFLSLPFVAAANSDHPAVTGSMPFSLLLLVVPWLAAFTSPRRQSLFDRLTGSFVAYRSQAGTGGKEQLAEVRKRSVRAAVVTAFFGILIIGILGYIANEAFTDRDRRTRIAYALGETESARERMFDFQARERRWPTATEIGLPEWSPYPAGGGFRVRSGGRIVITFEKTPGLKGNSITLHPSPELSAAQEGCKPEGASDPKCAKLREEARRLAQWTCRADPAIDPRYLPAICR